MHHVDRNRQRPLYTSSRAAFMAIITSFSRGGHSMALFLVLFNRCRVPLFPVRESPFSKWARAKILMSALGSPLVVLHFVILRFSLPFSDSRDLTLIGDFNCYVSSRFFWAAIWLVQLSLLEAPAVGFVQIDLCRGRLVLLEPGNSLFASYFTLSEPSTDRCANCTGHCAKWPLSQSVNGGTGALGISFLLAVGVINAIELRDIGPSGREKSLEAKNRFKPIGSLPFSTDRVQREISHSAGANALTLARYNASDRLDSLTCIAWGGVKKEESFGTVSERRGSRVDVIEESKSCNYVSKHITYRITKKACMAELSGGAKRCCIF
ncbi:UNVERIFIED_CONTAM: hypothetical protein Scaly_2885000 [Sesamum calycinum]|uniref:Uncharacterized protein n=1 Tax=Sesamum calycinum TaxID=2727403 RepID=A0AAW2LAF5_9LAMI